MNKVRYYREKIDAIRDIIEVGFDTYSDPLTVILSSNTFIDHIFDTLYIDYIQGALTTSQLNMISNVLDGLKAFIYESIIKYVLDKYS